MPTSKSLQEEYGPYPVEEIDDLSIRASPVSSLPLKVYSCQGKGDFPVIIFSHGAGASKDFYRSLGYFWASHGYMCIHPTHADLSSGVGKKDSSMKRNFLELMGYILTNSEAWLKRAFEISLIIDSLNLIEAQEAKLKGKFNVHKIGVGGHSFGAYTAQLIGGATIDIPDCSEKKSLVDERVQALLLLSPQGRGQQGLSDSSWESIKSPLMIITGTQDRNASGKGPEWRREPFDFSPPGDKYCAIIEGANHFSFGGNLDGVKRTKEPLIRQQKNRNSSTSSGKAGGIFSSHSQSMVEGEHAAQILNHVQNISLAFWDSYLKADGESKAYLNDISTGSISLEGFFLSMK